MGSRPCMHESLAPPVMPTPQIPLRVRDEHPCRDPANSCALRAHPNRGSAAQGRPREARDDDEQATDARNRITRVARVKVTTGSDGFALARARRPLGLYARATTVYRHPANRCASGRCRIISIQMNYANDSAFSLSAENFRVQGCLCRRFPGLTANGATIFRGSSLAADRWHKSCPVTDRSVGY
jgi:hypothetical protein